VSSTDVRRMAAAPARRLAAPSCLLSLTLAACGGAGSHGSAAPAPPVPPPAPSAHTDVVTYKNDLARTGQNLTESVLTTGNVNASRFGLQRVLAVDGNVDATPLYLSALTVQGAAHDVLFVATEMDSLYAFDSATGSLLWHVSLLPGGESPIKQLPDGCQQVAPTIGITATPVIDRSAGAHGVIYVVAMSVTASGTYHQRLHALDVTTGAEVSGGPVDIAASYPTLAGSTSFDPLQYEERAALLLLNGTLYTSWTSHCDAYPYTGWIIGYDSRTLARTAVLNVAPNSGGMGPAIWMSGGGPAADAAGNIYVLTANGVFETTLDAQGRPNQGDYGNSFLKLSTVSGALAVSDYFTMYNEVAESASDLDLGSGAILLLPDLNDSGGVVRHLAIGAGKDGNLYVVNRDALGGFNSGSNHIWQELPGALAGGIWSTPAYFNGSIYYGPSNGALRAFAIRSALLAATPSSSTSMSFTYPGASPAISANGAANGIVWAHENGTPAVLHAYDAADLTRELYNSSQAPDGRDQFGPGNKFITPVIADGRVFVGGQKVVAVFGLLN